MRRILASLALAAAASTLQAQQTARVIPIAQDPHGVARRIDEHLERLVPYGFSGSVLVAKDGQVVLANGYGAADRENGVPVTAETVFDIGSITKQFTAAAILKLEMEGRLSVNDPLGRWFPNVPADKQGITLHHLLTHSSGLRDTFGRDYAVAERDSLAGVILASRLLWAPGTRYRYSNAGYSLLGMVVEKASGKGYERYLREALWTPAGLARTGYQLPWRAGELAVGYRDTERWGTPAEQRWAPDGPWWNLRANGGVLSNVADLFRWHQALEGDAILSAAAREKMYTPHVAEDESGESHYGYGWALMPTARGTRLITHNGGNGVFFAEIRRYVDEGVVVVVMSNTSDFPAERALPALTRTLFSGEVPAPPVAIDADPARAAAAAGTYRLADGGAFMVAADGARLTIRPEGPRAWAVLNGGEADARLAELGARTMAALDAAGRGDYAPLHQAFGAEMPIQELRGMHEEFLSGVRERLGAARGMELVGVSARGPVAAVLVRMRFERGPQLLRVSWEDGRVAGIQPVREPAPPLFVPVAADAWASYDVATGASTRVRIEPGALVVDTPAGPVRAARANGTGNRE